MLHKGKQHPSNGGQTRVRPPLDINYEPMLTLVFRDVRPYDVPKKELPLRHVSLVKAIYYGTNS
jgi:hypothetical protein